MDDDGVCVSTAACRGGVLKACVLCAVDLTHSLGCVVTALAGSQVWWMMYDAGVFVVILMSDDG